MNLEYRYGHYILKLRYADDQDFCQVTIEDCSSFQFPLVWSLPMNKAQANKAIERFQESGFFNFNQVEHL